MVNDALRAASGIQEVKIFEAKVKNLNTKRKAGFNWEELLNFFFKPKWESDIKLVGSQCLLQTE